MLRRRKSLRLRTESLERRDLLAFDIVIAPGPLLRFDFPALAAFNRAAEQWEKYIDDDITVIISADLADLGDPNIIGQAASVMPFASHDNMRAALINDAGAGESIVNFLPSLADAKWAFPANFAATGGIQGTKANLKALGFQNLDALSGPIDATIQFNTQFAFDYDNRDGVGFGLTDFETVAAHEIGHALGFVSEVDTVDFFQALALPRYGIPNLITPGVMDLFRFADNAPGYDPENPADFGFVPRALIPGQESVMDDGSQEYRLSTGSFFGDFNQASHWKDDFYTFSNIGVMDPTLSAGVATPVGMADLWALDLIGYDINFPPTAVADTAVTTQNQPVIIDVLANDVDPDGTFPKNSIQIVSGPFAGTAAQNPATGLITYRPAADFVGTDTFIYNVTDAEGKTTENVTVTVTVNADPSSSPQAVSKVVAFATPAVYRPQTGTFFLRGSQTSGAPDVATFNFGTPGSVPIVGDWNGDGVDTVGVYDPQTSNFFLTNGLGTPGSVTAFNFGKPGYIPLAGDWDGDGIDTVGVFNPLTGSFFLRNSNTTGAANISFDYGAPSWTPVVGDWDGDGVDSIGVFEPVTASWFLRNTNSAGAVDVAPFSYGGSGWKPVVGDWDGEYTDTIGVWNPQTGEYHLRNSNTPGAADVAPFTYGGGGLVPLVGHWTPGQQTTVIPTPKQPGPSIPASSVGGFAPLSWRQIDVHGEHTHVSTDQNVTSALAGSVLDISTYESLVDNNSTESPAERFFSAAAGQTALGSFHTQANESVQDAAFSDERFDSHSHEELDTDELSALSATLERLGHPRYQAADAVLQKFFS